MLKKRSKKRVKERFFLNRTQLRRNKNGKWSLIIRGACLQNDLMKKSNKLDLRLTFFPNFELPFYVESQNVESLYILKGWISFFSLNEGESLTKIFRLSGRKRLKLNNSKKQKL